MFGARNVANLLRNLVAAGFSLIVITSLSLFGVTSHAAAIESAAFTSRELVDLEYLSNGSLAILVSSPGTGAPGLYRWDANDVAPRKLCSIASPSFFSFDRKLLIERERGQPSRIRVYSPADCGLIAAFEVAGRVLDIDVRGRLVAAAVRLPSGALEMQLLQISGELIATSAVGRNVEMGFSPDGKLIVNFDLSDAGLQAWRVPRMTPVSLPTWLLDGDTTFVPGSRFVKRYQNGKLSLIRWPTGTTAFAINASRALRLRALSADARIGLAHELLAQGEALQWINFTRDERIVLARGSIDNAALARDVSQAAWSLRLSGKEQRVLVQRRALSGALRHAPLEAELDDETYSSATNDNESTRRSNDSANPQAPPAATEAPLAGDLLPRPPASAQRNSAP